MFISISNSRVETARASSGMSRLVHSLVGLTASLGALYCSDQKGGQGTFEAMPDASALAAFSASISLSPEIQTVGVMDWTWIPSDAAATILRATVRFGRTPLGEQEPAWEHAAPVDLELDRVEGDGTSRYRTVLLGMKQNDTYSVRIEVKTTQGVEQVSESYTLRTGALTNGLAPVAVTDVLPDKLFGGFTTACSGISAGEAWVFILDKDGDYVWAYELTETAVAACSRARMSYDGRHMWVGSFGAFSPESALMRITMDGLLASEPYELPGHHHDFAVLPNNSIAYPARVDLTASAGNEGPDIIYELDPVSGLTRELYHQLPDFAEQIGERGAHTNQLNYVPELDALSFSLRHSSTIGLVSYPEGQLLAVFGGEQSDFPLSWDIQHGHEVTSDRLLVFNNNGKESGSTVFDFAYNHPAKTAKQVLEYSSGKSSAVFGDVKRLPNGNVFITYSAAGTIHEITASGELVRETTLASIGYSEHRKTLYGPPPPF